MNKQAKVCIVVKCSVEDFQFNFGYTRSASLNKRAVVDPRSIFLRSCIPCIVGILYIIFDNFRQKPPPPVAYKNVAVFPKEPDIRNLKLCVGTYVQYVPICVCLSSILQ